MGRVEYRRRYKVRFRAIEERSNACRNGNCARYSQVGTVFFISLHPRRDYFYGVGQKHCVRERPTKMPSAKEFRANADDCLVWARTVTSEHERAIFLDMARNWLEAASKAEGRKITYKLRAKRWSKSSPATTYDESARSGRNHPPQKSP
jgi:hypothetical protein